MEFAIQHRYRDQPPERIWEVLFDPECLSRAIPGCQRFDPQGNDLFLATLGLDVGPIKGGFDGSIALSDAEPPRRYRLRLEGTGPPGQVAAQAWISLEPDGRDTKIDCRAEVGATGTLAAVGQRVLVGVGRMLAGRFFRNIEQELSDRRVAG